MRRLLIAGLLALLPTLAQAQDQNHTCPTATPGTNNNQCASTAFVAQAIASGTIPSQPTNTLFGNVSGVTAVPSSLTAAQSLTLLGLTTFSNLTIGSNLQTTGSVLNTVSSPTFGGTTKSFGAGNQFGTAAGNIILPTTSNTNLLFYNQSSTNWAGIGSDTSGDVYIADVNGAGVNSKFWCLVNVTYCTLAGSPPANDNSFNIATTSWVQSNTSAQKLCNVATHSPVAVGDGVTNDTAAIQACINTGLTVYLPAPTKCYLVASDLAISTPGQLVYGDGKTRSPICVSTPGGFTNGVFTCSTGEPGPRWENMQVGFIQPSAPANRAALTQYVPAFYCPSTPRISMHHVRVANAWGAFFFTGNDGGTEMDDIECSAYNICLQMDGSLDTVRVNSLHCWPFGTPTGGYGGAQAGLTTQQMTIYNAAPTTCMYIGHVDGLMMTDFLNLSNLGLNMVMGGDGQPPNIMISNFGFDGYSGVLQNAGELHLSNGYFVQSGTSGVYAYIMDGTGGAYATITNFREAQGSPDTSPFTLEACSLCNVQLIGGKFTFLVAGVPLIATANNWLGSDLTVADSDILLQNHNTALLATSSISGTDSNVHLLNNTFIYSPSSAHTTPVINIASGIRSTIIGNRVQDCGTGCGTFISIPNDDFHYVSGNVAPGWTLSFPTPTQGFYSNNPH